MTRARGAAPHGATDRGFRYAEAFARNQGWVTAAEQLQLRRKRVAIGGMGGVGGVHLLTLARLGIGAFHLADFDRFELANMNRQAGASVETLGEPKVQVMAKRALGINPTLELRCFPEGVQPETVDAFLADVDLYVDGLDFFAFGARRLVFARCRELGIPAVTAAPLGMGVAYLLFTPDGLSFEDYFQLDGLSPSEQAARFAVGLAPAGLMRGYLVDPSQLDLAAQRGPSTPMACQLCAGVAGTEALKLLLGRGSVRPAPWYHHFDAYRGRWVSRRRGPLHGVKVWFAQRVLARLHANRPAPVPAAPRALSQLEQILDLARWAPSGDNSQPWRFAIEGPDRIRIELRDQEGEDVYDVLGRPTLIAGGCLLESLRLAASRYGRRLSHRYVGQRGRVHTIDVQLPWDFRAEDRLCGALQVRATDRRSYRRAPLSARDKRELEADVAPLLSVRWHETLGERWRIARLNAAATNLRMRLPEARQVHRRVLDWEDPASPHGIPIASTGMDPFSRATTRWLLARDARWRLVEACPGSTGLAQLQLDLLPGLRCGAHVSLRLAPEIALDASTLLEVGMRVQRFWLRATELGLSMQPGMAPLLFATYAREGLVFSADAASTRRCEALRLRFDRLFEDPGQVMFLARLGRPLSPLSVRSSRRPLAQLLLPAPPRRAPRRQDSSMGAVA